MNKFETTGSVLNIPPPERRETMTDDDAKTEVSSVLIKSPQTSVRRMSARLSISRSSVHRIYKELGFKPHIPRLVHALNEDDYDRRSEFGEPFLELLEDEPDLIDRVIWSYEAIFKLNGEVNRQNMVFWARDDPNISLERSMKTEKVTVWAGIWSKGIIGPYFFEENVNGDNYLTMLNDYFYPSYCDLPDDKPIFFMHDGAPPHYSLKVREWLDQNLSGH